MYGAAARAHCSGTGASCIYPLIAARLHPAWRLLATDIDRDSVRHALANTARNGLAGQIRVVLADPEDQLLARVAAQDEPFHFCICNPPFYPDRADVRRRSALKQSAARTALCYSDSEAVYPGGEAAFVQRIIGESLVLTHRIHWYTALLGLKESVAVLQRVLQTHRVPRTKVFTSKVGHTRRWILAWSFAAPRGGAASRAAARDLVLHFPEDVEAAPWLRDQLARLGVRLSEDGEGRGHCFEGHASCRTWSRAGRRRLAQAGLGGAEEIALVFDLRLLGRQAVFSLRRRSDDAAQDAADLGALVNHLRRALSSGAREEKTCLLAKEPRL